MNYALLDTGGEVTAVYVYTSDQYAELLPAMQNQLIGCPDDIVVGCVLTDTGWSYPADQLDAEFAANPSLYIENKCTIVNTRFDDVLTHGFQYTDNKRYKGDIRSQLWAIAYMFTMVQGLMTPPVNWIAADNSITQFPTAPSFAAFIAFFLNWGQTTTFENYTAKMQMRAQTTRAAVDSIFTAYFVSAGLSS